MDEARLAVLDGLSCYHRVACADGKVAGFLLAMCSGTPYENENFEWFARRYSQFIYVDRIVVSSAFKGLRVGSSLYDDLFRHARDAGIGLVTCEYNIVPPNEPSRSFHEKFGFEEQGTRWAAGGDKRVSMQAAVVGRADVPASALP
jgi:predicted GNAT superfamily acetyltransferase